METLKFNDFEAYKGTSIPKGKTVTFQLIGIMDDPDNPGRKIIPRQFIRPKDSVFIDGKVHEIAVITNENKGDIQFDTELMFGPENGGKIVLRSGSPVDEKRYPFLKFSNQNASNEYRDESILPIFKEVDFEADENTKFEIAEAEAKAQTTILALNEAQLKAVGEALKVPATLSSKATKMMILDFVKQDASKVLAVLEGVAEEETGASSDLKQLNEKFKKKVLKNDKEAKQVLFDGKVIYTYLTEELDKEDMLQVMKTTDSALLEEILK